MLFGMSTIILKWSHSPDLIIFRYSCFKIGQSEPRVAYKSVAYKKKACTMLSIKNDLVTNPIFLTSSALFFFYMTTLCPVSLPDPIKNGLIAYSLSHLSVVSSLMPVIYLALSINI